MRFSTLSGLANNQAKLGAPLVVVRSFPPRMAVPSHDFTIPLTTYIMQG